VPSEEGVGPAATTRDEDHVAVAKDRSEIQDASEDDENQTVYLLTTGDDPPPVRYKIGTDPLANVRAWASDLAEVPGRFQESVDGLLGGGGGGN